MRIEDSIKKNTQYIKILALAIFGVLIFLAIYKKPELPEEVKENFRETAFKTFGGLNADSGWAVIKAANDGYLIAGETASFGGGNKDAYVIRTDGAGTLAWTRTFGAGGNDSAISAVRAENDTYIIAGGTDSFGYGESDVYAVKFDDNGEVIWEKTYGGANHDYGYSIIKAGSGYIIAGYSSSFSDLNSEAYLIKISGQGDLIWEKTYGSYNWEIAYSVSNTPDKGYVLAGYTNSFGSGKTDMLVIKTDSEGNSQWVKTFGGSREDRAYHIAWHDNGYIISGKTTSYISKGFGWDMMLLRTDSEGNSKWSTIFPASETEVGTSVVPVKGGYILYGTKKCYGICDPNLYMVRVDSKGTTINYRIFSGHSAETAGSIIRSYDNDFLVTGMTMSYGHGRGDVLLSKITRTFEQDW